MMTSLSVSLSVNVITGRADDCLYSGINGQDWLDSGIGDGVGVSSLGPGLDGIELSLPDPLLVGDGVGVSSGHGTVGISMRPL